MKKIKLLVIAVLSLLIIIQVAWAALKPPAKKRVSTCITVETGEVSQRDIPLRVSAVGSLAAFHVATLSAAVDGHVLKIFYNNGQDVKKTDQIVQLDATKDEADLQAAKATLKLSQLTLARYLEVKKVGAVSTQVLNKAQADVASQTANVKRSTATLNQKKILAPFEGVLGEFQVNVGDYVTAGQAVVSLVNNSHLKVRYDLPQKYVSKIKIDQKVKITFDGIHNRVFSGRVTFISPSINESTRSVAVEATMPNKGGALSPGMFAHIEQIVGVDKDSLVVPEESISASLAGNYVYRIVEGKAISTKVKVGNRIRGYAQVLKGLALHQQVITAGIQKLSEGSRVCVAANDSEDKAS